MKRTDSTPEERMQDLVNLAYDGGHDDDCDLCAMSRIIALLERHPNPEFLGAVRMAISRLEVFGSARLPE